MKIKVIIILSFMMLKCFGNQFEQNGVKEGNNRISVALLQEQKYQNNKESSLRLDITLGRFISDISEVSIQIHDSTDFNNHSYKVDVSYNYYFLKHLTYSPYIGFELGVTGDTYMDSDKLNDEEGLSVGVHQFFTEDLALTVEAGLDFYQLKSLTEQYTTISLTMFF